MATPRAKTRMKPSELNLYHNNPRQGDVAEMKVSLLKNGQYKPVTVNAGTLTGRPFEVLGGNHTVMAIRELLAETDDPQWKSVLVHVIDVDEAHARRIMLVDNKSGQKGGYDDAKLAEELSKVAADDADLEGTGYTEKELEKLLADEVIDGDAPVDDSPVAYGVVVDCDNEEHQVRLLEQLEAEGLRVRALM